MAVQGQHLVTARNSCFVNLSTEVITLFSFGGSTVQRPIDKKFKGCQALQSDKSILADIFLIS